MLTPSPWSQRRAEFSLGETAPFPKPAASASPVAKAGPSAGQFFLTSGLRLCGCSAKAHVLAEQRSCPPQPQPQPCCHGPREQSNKITELGHTSGPRKALEDEAHPWVQRGEWVPEEVLFVSVSVHDGVCLSGG